MYTIVESIVNFRGTPTTDEERILLRDHGFIHVTGLKATVPYHVGDDPDHYFIGANLKLSESARWGSNNGVTVINTKGGEVWVRLSTGEDSDFAEVQEAVKALGLPDNGGVFVPLSNGENVEWVQVMRRVANPSYGIHVVN